MTSETKKTVLSIKDLKVDFETATGTVNAVQGVDIHVQAGETVAIVVEGGGFSLSRQAVALEEVAIGSWIKVRPAQDKKAEPVRAQVVRPGQVTVRLH